MNKYLNLWADELNIKKPSHYVNDAKLVGEHRGVRVFKLVEHGYDFVFEGACITQRAGASKFKEVIDGLLDGKEWCHSDKVANHLIKFGFSPMV